MDGWIKLHRKCFDNFLYRTNKPHTRREAWEDILVNVNYEDAYWSSGNEKIECKRGQSLLSLDSWGRILNWDKSRVKRFFDLLKTEKMITIENMKKTTRLTVCNYVNYQGEQNDNETQKKRKRPTIKEEEELRDINISLWRENFDEYLNECKREFRKHIDDPDFISKMKYFHSGVDIKKSIVASFEYWKTEEAWILKKSKKSTKKINWDLTIQNAIKKNKVYFTKEELQKQSA